MDDITLQRLVDHAMPLLRTAKSASNAQSVLVAVAAALATQETGNTRLASEAARSSGVPQLVANARKHTRVHAVLTLTLTLTTKRCSAVRCSAVLANSQRDLPPCFCQLDLLVADLPGRLGLLVINPLQLCFRQS